MTENYDGKHESDVTVEVETTVVQTTPNTAIARLNHYAKAVAGALISGLLYLLTVLTPAATLGDITLLQWIGFTVSVLGTFTGVAVVTNGPKPTK